jgi:hypothetical protein
VLHMALCPNEGGCAVGSWRFRWSRLGRLRHRDGTKWLHGGGFTPIPPPHRRRRLDLLRDQRATTRRRASSGSGTTWRTNSATARLKLSKHKRTELGSSSIRAGNRQITAAGRHSWLPSVPAASANHEEGLSFASGTVPAFLVGDLPRIRRPRRRASKGNLDGRLERRWPRTL